MKAIKKLRLPTYDYASNGYYFVTICANYKKPYLVGEIKNVVTQFIEFIPTRILGASIDYYVIMPTHIHMILIFNECRLKLGEVVRRLKQSGIDLWQPNYYEHVIRNEKALGNIREYIRNNPLADKIRFEQFYESDKIPNLAEA